MDYIGLGLLALGVGMYAFGYYSHKWKVKDAEYLCPYCKKYHKIMPSRESDFGGVPPV